MSEAEAGTCRSCRAPILWVRNTRTGKRMPVDANPDSEEGNVLVNRQTGLAMVLSASDWDTLAETADPDPEAELHKSHFATCPQASSWRSKR